MITRRRQRGYLLVTVIITLFLVASVAVLLAHDSANSANTSNRELEAARVDYVAQAGMQHSLWQAQNSACMGDVTIPDTALGNDKYSATIKAAATGTLVTLSADQDAWIRSDDVSINNGTTTWNHLRNEVAGTEQVLTRFDLSSLAAKAQISSAVAWFHIKALTPHPEGSITIHEITADWAETAVTWESFAGAFSSSTIGMIPAQDTGDVWVAVNLTAQVQAWVNGQPNYGILFDPQADGTHAEYTAREDGSNPPRLEVVVGSRASSPVTIKVRGELDNGVKRALKDKIVPGYQPPSITTLQLGADPGMDAILDSFYERNYGGANYLQINNDGSWIQRPALRFELATVPHSAKVVSAQLELRRLGVNAPGLATVHRLTRSFVEGTRAGGGVADGATWATFDGINSWSSAGGDYDAAVVAETYIDGSEEWVSWEIGPLVDAWANGEPNYGLLIDGANGLKQAKFASREDGDPAVRPRLTITYACECGSPCMAPQGSGIVTMAVINPTTLVPTDAYKKALFESWGYTVNVISETANAADYTAAAASSDVFFISETVNSNQVGTKLVNVPIGVVSQDGDYNSDLGFAGGSSWPVSPGINVTDASHYITAAFRSGPLDIYSGGMEQLTVSGGEAAKLKTLADTGGAGSLVILEKGATMSGGGSAAGRRVMLPLGRDSSFNWNYLNNNGRLIVQRSLAWAMKADGGVTGKNVLLVVADAINMTAQDVAKQTLIEGWGHTVNLIDDDAAQTEFDAAYAVNDVVYVSEEILTGAISTKLRNAYIGVVFEEQKIPDELGVSSAESVYFETSIDVTDNTHYITETFGTGALTIVSSSQEVGDLGGTLAPGLQILARRPSSTRPTLAVIETGGALFDGGTAEGRRAKVPWGGNTFDINALTADGQTIMKRAIEWGAGEGGSGCANFTPLLFVVGDDAALTSQESARQALMQSWCYGVTLIDDGDSQANFDTAASNADVAYISSEVSASALGTKLKDNSIGIVTEDPDLHNDFGFSTVRYRSTTNAPLSTDSTHYITSPFAGADITLFTSVQPAGAAVGTLPAGLNTLGEWTSGDLAPLGGLLTLDTGAAISGGGTAAGRRVQMPWDGAEGGAVAEISALTTEGQTILQRSLEWAAGADKGPIAHWKLDETSGTAAVDSVGGHNGTLVGDASWAPGVLAGGLSLDGAGDRVDVSGLVGSPSSLTITAWVNLISAGFNGDEVISLGNNVLLRVDSFLQGGSYASYWDGSSYRQTTSGQSLGGSGWRHIAYTFDDAADQQFLYIDGVEAGSSTFATSISYTQASNTTIGAHPSSTSYNFNGQFDDVRIYDRALTSSEITELATTSETFCEADYVPDTKLSEFSTVAYGSRNIQSLTHLPEGKVFNGVAAPTGGAWISVNYSDGKFYMTDMAGTYLTEVTPPIGAPTGVTYVTSGTWADHLAVTAQTTAEIQYFDLAGNLVSSFSTVSLGMAGATDIAFIDSSASGVYDGHLAVVDANADLVVMATQDGNPVHNFDTSGYSTTTHGMDHLPGTDKLLLIDRNATAFVVDFDGAVLRQYDTDPFGTNAPEAIAINPLTCDHVVGDDSPDLVVTLGESGGGSGGGGGAGSCDGTYRDEFNATTFANNDGDLAWDGDWLEVGESDGPSSGDVRVRDDNGPYQLWIRDNDNGGEGVERQADLGGASSATLSFIYRRSLLDNANDYVKLEISSNGTAGPWSELGRIEGPGTDSAYLPFEIGIGEHASANTRIRFISSPTMGNTDLVIFDDIDITCTP